jgi:uncharacterized protein YxjI
MCEMKLYIKQKVFSWNDKFWIKDEAQRDRWFAEGEVFTFGKKLRVYDAQGAERAFICQKIFSFLPRYYIEIDGGEYEFAQKFTILRREYTLPALGWSIRGDFFAHSYAAENARGEIMRMQKAWMSWGDYYELDIFSPNDELMCLCAALAIDCMNANAAEGTT